jgi:hypothetical protein
MQRPQPLLPVIAEGRAQAKRHQTEPQSGSHGKPDQRDGNDKPRHVDKR